MRRYEGYSTVKVLSSQGFYTGSRGVPVGSPRAELAAPHAAAEQAPSPAAAAPQPPAAALQPLRSALPRALRGYPSRGCPGRGSDCTQKSPPPHTPARSICRCDPLPPPSGGRARHRGRAERPDGPTDVTCLRRPSQVYQEVVILGRRQVCRLLRRRRLSRESVHSVLLQAL